MAPARLVRIEIGVFPAALALRGSDGLAARLLASYTRDTTKGTFELSSWRPGALAPLNNNHGSRVEFQLTRLAPAAPPHCVQRPVHLEMRRPGPDSRSRRPPLASTRGHSGPQTRRVTEIHSSCCLKGRTPSAMTSAAAGRAQSSHAAPFDGARQTTHDSRLGVSSPSARTPRGRCAQRANKSWQI